MKNNTDIKPLDTGSKAPDFSLKNSRDEEVALSSYLGKWVVLYFYPMDNTPGCTAQACDFTANREDFSGLDAVIIGVSPDSTGSHRNFIMKKDLTIELLSDPDKITMEKFGAIGIRKLFGKEFKGVIRSTYLIDPNGFIAYHWPKVKVKGHAQSVKNRLKDIIGERNKINK